MTRVVEIQVIPSMQNGVRTYTVRSVTMNDDGSQTATVIMEAQPSLAQALGYLATMITPLVAGGTEITVQLG